MQCEDAALLYRPKQLYFYLLLVAMCINSRLLKTKKWNQYKQDIRILLQDKMYLFFKCFKYPNFQKKRNAISRSVSSEESEDIKNQIKEENHPNMQLRHKIIDLIEKPELRKQVKVSEIPNRNEEQRKRAQVKKKNEDMAVNDFYIQQNQQQFDDLYQFVNYNNNNNDNQSESGSQQEFRQNKLMKVDSLINQGTNNNKIIESQQFNWASYCSKDRFVKTSIVTSQNNSKMVNPVQFIVPPQNFLMNPSPIIQPLNNVYVGDDEALEAGGMAMNNGDGFRKYTNK